eukprot:CAMPEP_0167768124 /NCGR_PEP_ID=MMETSP0110_2-20121227/16461_1 /TAXON_ID=629695 /ORGANISM="Gymnochlora sp., Strain CCMP2014" /LENGTH=156 /DNA_ID=CAMNT_0007656699 /DNA_START=21 /DNA_END=491 /DNA_ORIENTATION=-
MPLLKGVDMNILVSSVTYLYLALYASWVFVTFVSPYSLWKLHYKGPMDPVFCYTARSKGAAILGLLVILAYSLKLEISERKLAFVGCLVFHVATLYAHSAALIFMSNGYYVNYSMHSLYVTIHAVSTVAFGSMLYLAHKEDLEVTSDDYKKIQDKA